MGFSLSRTLGLGKEAERIENEAQNFNPVGAAVNFGESVLSGDPSNLIPGSSLTKSDKNDGPSFNAEERRAQRIKDYATGSAMGQNEFVDDPEMQRLKAKREELAKGYDGQETAALRDQARREIAGQRSNYLSQMRSNLAKGGVGGARGAAVQNAASEKYAQQGAESERKLALDSAQMKRQGINDLQDFIFRQKLGKTGLAYGQQALGSADYAAEKGVQAANQGGKK
jgi:hypothetical protein